MIPITIARAFWNLVLLGGLAVPTAVSAQSTGRIQGHVWAPNGEPLSGAMVILEPMPSGANRRQTVDADGRFQFDVPAYESYRIRAEMVGFDVGQRVVSARAGSVGYVSFVLSVGAVADRVRNIHGEVVDEAKKPVSGAYVTISGLNGDAARTVITDKHGNFLLDNVSSKPLLAVALAPGLSGAVIVPVRFERTVVNIALSRTMSLDGR